MEIKWRLAYVMLDRNMKTGQLARKTGMATQTISRLKSYQVIPTMVSRKTLESLCDALKCEPGDLMSRFVP